jgi:hypothetical protein
MTKEELIKFSEHEIQWLRYYATSRTCVKLTHVEHLYEDLAILRKQSSKQLALYDRCSAAMLTFDSELVYIGVDDIYIVNKGRSVENDIYTPLEMLIRIYPDERDDILKKLKHIGN